MRFWDIPPDAFFPRTFVEPGELLKLSLNGAGNELIATTRDGLNRRWHLDRPPARLPARLNQSEGFSGLELGVDHEFALPDGLATLTVASDGVARLRDLATGKTLGPVLGRNGIHTVAFGASGTRLAVGGSDGKIAVWDSCKPYEGSAELRD